MLWRKTFWLIKCDFCCLHLAVVTRILIFCSHCFWSARFALWGKSIFSLTSFERQILLPSRFISHLYFFVVCKILPAFRTKFEWNLQRLSTRGTKHGVEGRRRSCVSVRFSLPTLGVLRRMCCEVNGQGPIPKTQHVHNQQMFLLLTNHKSKFLQRAKK